MDLYDIVRLVIPDNEDLDGKSAFVTRIPASASDVYDLFFPGDDSAEPAFLTYNETSPEKGTVPNVVTDDSLKNPYKTLAETLDIKQGSYLAGTLRENPSKTHALQVVRFTDTSIIVTRTNTSTEQTIEIPMENGIGVGSIYGFLRPAVVGDDSEPELDPEKKAFLERINDIPDISIIYTKTPLIQERTEIPTIGGTHDMSRLTGQIVSAIRAIDSKDKTDNTRIQNLIQETTLYNGDSRVIIAQDEPIMIRSKLPFPPWMIPIDESRVDGIVTSQNTSERIQDEREVNRKRPYHLLNKITGSGLRMTPARGDGIQEIPERMEVIFSKEPPVDISKPFKGTYTTDFYRKRVLLPAVPNACSRTPISSSFRDPDYYKPGGTVVLPPRHYAPPMSPLLHRMSGNPWVSPTSIDPDSMVESSVPLSNTLIVSRFLLPPESIGSVRAMMSYTSPRLESVLTLPMSHGGIDEIGRKGVAYGFDKHGILTHSERVIASSYLKIAKNRIRERLGDRDVLVPLYSVSPKGLYKDLGDLQLLYPTILGLISKEEALDRIIQTQGDHGRVLLGMMGADEYTSMDSTIRDIITNAEGKRIRVREEMADVQSRLRELETTLRTLPMIAKHYGSRKEVEKAKGSIPLWDEHLDDDPDKRIYYSDRFRKIVGRVLNEMQSMGELEIRGGEDTGDDLIGKIPPEKLEEAVREDLNRYNLSVGETAQITGERFDTMVQRIILGGRPVREGDVALITRHLRTAAYRWDEKNLRWNPIRDDEDIFAGDDINPKANSTRIFTKTLHLNKEYRQLSKTRDDLEMIAKRPEIMTDPEKLTESLNTLVENVSKNADSRIVYLQRNRVIDEIPFLYDRIEYTNIRYSYEIPEDGEEDSRISRADLRRARVEATLETDTDLDLFEAGYGAILPTTERFGSAGSILANDPVLKITNERMGPSTFISEVSGRDRLKRVFLATIGFMEILLRSPLTQGEVVMSAREVDTILPVKATNRDAIQRGVGVYCAMIGSRMSSSVLIPKSEGETPPPVKNTLPSYRVPFRDTEDDGLLEFIVRVLTKSARMSVEGRSTTAFSVILKNIGRVGVTRTREDPDGKSAITRLRDIISRISRGSPSITARVLQTRTQKIRVTDTEKGLRMVKRWETIPIIHNPHPESSIIRIARDLLQDVEVFLKDEQGNPYPANSGLELPINTPNVIYALEKIHNTRSENLQELFYSRRLESVAPMQSLVVTGPAPAYIGVIRGRIPTVPLTDMEAPTTSPVTPEPMGSITPRDIRGRAGELLKDLIDEILREGEIGHLSRVDSRPMNSLNRELRAPEDTNGALKGGFIAFHDAVLLAIQQYSRILLGENEPTSCEQILYPSEYSSYQKGSREIPIYTAHEIVKGLIRGISPLSIQYSKRTYPEKGGSRNTVLTGDTTYFARVREIVGILEDLSVRTVDILAQIVGNIRTLLSDLPDVVTRPQLMDVVYSVLNEGSDIPEKIMGIELYLTLLGHSSNIFQKTPDLSLIHSDINDTILDEELNYDRERERQRFIYQLEALDPERRELARASRALGVDLAGTVAKDPRKFNAEYYQITNSLVATQEMQDQVPEMSGAYGDQGDVQGARDAVEGAFEGVDQIEGIDFD